MSWCWLSKTLSRRPPHMFSSYPKNQSLELRKRPRKIIRFWDTFSLKRPKWPGIQVWIKQVSDWCLTMAQTPAKPYHTCIVMSSEAEDWPGLQGENKKADTNFSNLHKLIRRS